MARLRALASRYRLVGVAVALSLALHAAVMVGMPKRLDAVDARTEAIYSATLDALATPATLAPAAPVPAPAAARPARPRAKARVASAKPVAALPADDATPLESLAEIPALAAPEMAKLEDLQPLPDRLALAAPTAPRPEEEAFPVEAMPASLSIDYALSSSFADGRATYRWRRDGDSYRITGEAQAEGFFALFLEGQIVQESRGTLTGEGLRPDRFSENRPGAQPEGLEFDWAAGKVTFDRNGTRKTDKLEANTVDWLSMIFQLAHRPPSTEALDMRVFTQRKLYSFRLQVLGTEEIQIPLGRVRALHLRHADPKDANDVVDVWLGVDYHYVPVKLRFPVAKNRLVVEQVATRVTEN